MSVVVQKRPRPAEDDPALAILMESLRTRRIEHIPLSRLKRNPRNAKKHPRKQIEILANNFTALGFTSPILIDEDNLILAGHARYEAANLLNLPQLPVIKLVGLSPEQKIAVALSDNKLGELGTWDAEICVQELQRLYEADTDFDLQITGFSVPEVDALVALQQKGDPAENFDLPTPNQTAVSRLDDVWICGHHKLVCGSALEYSTYARLLGDELVESVFTDPPFNVRVKGHVSRRTETREFVQASGELESGEFEKFLGTTAHMISRTVADGAMIFVCMDWRHLSTLHKAAEPTIGAPRNLIIWVKDNFGLGTQYRSQHETISLFVAGKSAAFCNVKPGGRSRSNVWNYAGCNSFGRGRDESLAMHPTVKPVALVMDALLDSSRRRGLVLDPFGGSGTTMIAAERIGRRARLVELDPLYCDTTIRRWQKLTNNSAILEGTGQTFEAVSEARQQPREQ